MDTLAAAGLCLTVAVFIYYSLKPQPLPSLPHNSNLPWFSGDIPQMARVMQETGRFTTWFERMAEKHGPIYQAVLGAGNSWISKWIGMGGVLVVVNDAQEIQDITLNRSAEFDRADMTVNLFHATVPTGLIAMPTNSMLKHHKRWLGLSMTAPYLARMVPRITEGIMELIALWSLSSQRLRNDASKERAFSAMDDIRLSTIDVIASITFGTSFNSISAAVDFLESDPHASASSRPPTLRLARSVQQLLGTIGRNALFPIPRLLTWWTKMFDTEWNRAHRHMHQFLGDKLDKARHEYEMSGQNQGKPEARLADNVLDMILEKEREEKLKGDAPLSRSEIIDELATYALGGSETTAATLMWAVKILARHPDVQHKLHQEVVAKLPPPSQRVATFEELSSTARLPYLSAVVYEVLRLAGTAAGTSRDTTCDTVILGHAIPKGTQVILLLANSQLNESSSYKAVSDALDPVRSESSRKNGRKHGYWADEDCAEFKPERWLTADGAFNPNAGPWMPFSFGFRGCFGQKLAILELRMYLAMMQATFFFDKIPEEFDHMKSKEAVTTHPTICYIRPIPWSETER